MKVIVTGSRGLIGETVFDYLFNLGHEVYGFDLSLGDNFCDEAKTKDLFVKYKADALVNCFALNDHIPKLRSDRLMETSLNAFRQYLDVNVTALFSVCREFKRNNPKGSIVNFSSTYGLGSPIPEMYGDQEKHIAYGVSKAAVIQLTKHLAIHWAPDMRVNCIVPGGVENGQTEEFIKEYSKHTPMKRMARVDEICGLVNFLISDEASYCTGGVYPVDGGWTAW